MSRARRPVTLRHSSQPTATTRQAHATLQFKMRQSVLVLVVCASFLLCVALARPLTWYQPVSDNWNANNWIVQGINTRLVSYCRTTLSYPNHLLFRVCRRQQQHLLLSCCNRHCDSERTRYLRCHSDRANNHCTEHLCWYVNSAVCLHSLTANFCCQTTDVYDCLHQSHCTTCTNRITLLATRTMTHATTRAHDQLPTHTRIKTANEFIRDARQ